MTSHEVLYAKESFQDYRQANAHALQLAQGLQVPAAVHFEPVQVRSEQSGMAGTLKCIWVHPATDLRGRMSGAEVRDAEDNVLAPDCYPDWEVLK